MDRTMLYLSTTALSIVFHLLSSQLHADTNGAIFEPKEYLADTISASTKNQGKTLIGKSITSKEVLVYRTRNGDSIVTSGGDHPRTVTTYRTHRGDTLVVEDGYANGAKRIRIAFPGENGKEVAVIREETLLGNKFGDFKSSATYKTFRGDTILMEDVKTGEKRKVRIIFPGVDGKTISVESETPLILADSLSATRRNSLDSLTRKDSTSADKSRHSVTIKEKHKRDNRRRAIFGITFSRIDLGFTRPMSDGGFAMEGENKRLDYHHWKTTNFGFDLLQLGYRFSPQFRLFLSGGLDWTYIRLKEDVEFDRNQAPYAYSADLPGNVRKNRLTSTYLRLPLTFEVKGPQSSDVRFAFGPIAGFLLKGTQRYRLEDDKTFVKRRGDYGFAPFQYGAFARFGYRHLGLYGKYYFNDMFENSPAGAGLKNFTFGVTAAF